MKTKIALLTTLVVSSISVEIHAQLPAAVPVPAVTLAGVIPKLYPAEQGAFKALEVATQIIEAKIAQTGCRNRQYDVEVQTGADGSGKAVLSNPWSQVTLEVALGDKNIINDGVSANNGRWYTVTGSGSLGRLKVSDIEAQGSFTIGSALQELRTQWKMTSPVTLQLDVFEGTVIKDYLRLSDRQLIPDGFDDAGVEVSAVIDYGYQQLTKENYVKAKYWQQSLTWRDDGVNAGVHWLITRVAPLNQQPCVIEVKLQGYGQSPTDNIEGFHEKGTLAVKTIEIGPFFREPTKAK
jgi:hypothetical protein